MISRSIQEKRIMKKLKEEYQPGGSKRQEILDNFKYIAAFHCVTVMTDRARDLLELGACFTFLGR